MAKLAFKEYKKFHQGWEITKKDFEETLFAQIVSVTGGVVGGFFLAVFLKRLELLPALFIVLPGFLEMRGSIGGSLSARLSSALFLGYLKPNYKNHHILKGNTIAAFSLALLVGSILGVLAYLVELYIFGIAFVQIIPIMIFAAILSNLIEIPLAIFLTFRFFKRGIDPNNVMGPYITTIGDVVSIISIVIATIVIL